MQLRHTWCCNSNSDANCCVCHYAVDCTGRSGWIGTTVLVSCTQTVSRRIELLSQHTCVFHLRPQEITALSKPIFRKITHAQRHFLRICYTEFGPNSSINVDTTGLFCALLGKVSLLLLHFSTKFFAFKIVTKLGK